MKKLILLALVACSALLLGCHSVPMASISLDSDAKKFQPESGKSSIYINRKKAFVGGGVVVQSVVDRRIIGSLTPGTFQLISAVPGEHMITTSGQSHDENQIKFQTESGKNYFFDISVNMGFMEPYIKVLQVETEEGQKDVTASNRAETTSY